MEKINRTPEGGLQKFSGKRIVLCGNGKKRDSFVSKLSSMIEEQQSNLVLLSDMNRLQADDYVLLFGDAESFTHTDLLDLGKKLQKLINDKPQSVVFLSDYAVYGKCFGEMKERTEEEIGYISHTAKEMQSVQNLRMAEHLICRIAREDAVHAKAVRTDLSLSAESCSEVLYVLQALLNGVCGEIYNLPVNEEETTTDRRNGTETDQSYTWDEMRSPLSPMEIVPNTAKFQEGIENAAARLSE